MSAPGSGPRRSYYVRNPWRPWVAGGMAGASTILTTTTLFYALGRLPLALVGISDLRGVAWLIRRGKVTPAEELE